MKSKSSESWTCDGSQSTRALDIDDDDCGVLGGGGFEVAASMGNIGEFDLSAISTFLSISKSIFSLLISIPTSSLIISFIDCEPKIELKLTTQNIFTAKNEEMNHFCKMKDADYII